MTAHCRPGENAGTGRVSPSPCDQPEREPKELDPRWTAQVTDEMKAAIAGRAVDGKVTCPMLRKFAEDIGVPYQVAGAAADLAGIRVRNCDLGCF